MTRRNRRRDESTTPRDHQPDRREPAISGPTPDAIGEALHVLLETPVKQTPKLSAVRTLRNAGMDFPLTVGDKKIIGVAVTRGRPQHGEMRSDDHISYYEVEFDAECPKEDCYSQVTRYKHSVHHNISGSEETFCPRCDTVHDSEEWG